MGQCCCCCPTTADRTEPELETLRLSNRYSIPQRSTPYHLPPAYQTWGKLVAIAKDGTLTFNIFLPSDHERLGQIHVQVRNTPWVQQLRKLHTLMVNVLSDVYIPTTGTAIDMTEVLQWNHKLVRLYMGGKKSSGVYVVDIDVWLEHERRWESASTFWTRELMTASL